jgi:hypothetical protein
MIYLGHSPVDAPKSENEAARKMEAMRQQASQASDPLQIVMVVPMMNEGFVSLLDTKGGLPLMKFPIKYILFCARGRGEETGDCLCINVRTPAATNYHCHVFRAPSFEIVSVLFFKKA